MESRRAALSGSAWVQALEHCRSSHKKVNIAAGFARPPPTPGRRNVNLPGPLVRDRPEGDSARNVVAALAAARELPRFSFLKTPLELTMLIARNDPSRHPRVAAC